MATLKISKRRMSSPSKASSTALSSAELSFPHPESKEEAYTSARLQQSLSYANGFLARRDISPRSKTFMVYFKEVVTGTLEVKNHAEKLKSANEVRTLEVLIAKNVFLRPTDTMGNQELQNALLELRESQYMNRYGDYIKVIPTDVRLYASQHRTENWEYLSGRHHWTEIAARLGKEDTEFQLALRKGPSAMDEVNFQTHTAIGQACSRMGFSENLVIWSIQSYAERNESVHRDIEWLRQHCEFQQLAKILHDDLKDIIK